ncbi:hypothetical protein BDY24DRAFT_416512 [Mrakia frigida]|uniref:uncharacterized protein n=1 Tax=Mrakia frigida TaxID=29902 RepID=UPI003FCBF96A
MGGVFGRTKEELWELRVLAARAFKEVSDLEVVKEYDLDVLWLHAGFNTGDTTSASKIVSLIDERTIKDSEKFFHCTGSEIPW